MARAFSFMWRLASMGRLRSASSSCGKTASPLGNRLAIKLPMDSEWAAARRPPATVATRRRFEAGLPRGWARFSVLRSRSRWAARFCEGRSSWISAKRSLTTLSSTTSKFR